MSSPPNYKSLGIYRQNYAFLWAQKKLSQASTYEDGTRFREVIKKIKEDKEKTLEQEEKMQEIQVRVERRLYQVLGEHMDSASPRLKTPLLFCIPSICHVFLADIIKALECNGFDAVEPYELTARNILREKTISSKKDNCKITAEVKVVNIESEIVEAESDIVESESEIVGEEDKDDGVIKFDDRVYIYVFNEMNTSNMGAKYMDYL